MSEKGITGAGVGIMVLQDNKILLGLRSTDPAKADSELNGEGTWTCPGGKIRFGESFEEAATRELTEETGLLGDGFRVYSISNDIGNEAHYVTIGLLCDKFSGELKTMEPDEIIRWQWFDLNSLPPNMFIPSRKMVDNYLLSNFYFK